MQDVCGDGWTIDVIAHLLKGLNNPDSEQIPGQMDLSNFIEGFIYD